MVSTSHPTATNPNEVLEHIYLGTNSYGSAETKTDVLSQITSLDTWTTVTLAATGTDIGAYTQPRAWLAVYSYRWALHGGEEEVDCTTDFFIEHITVEQWAN